MTTRHRQRTEFSEKEFQQQILDLAKSRGWNVYHTFDSRRSAPGFPDLVMVRVGKSADGYDGQLIFAELKTDKGKVSAAQWTWLHALASVLHVGVYVFRPRYWKRIEELLK